MVERPRQVSLLAQQISGFLIAGVFLKAGYCVVA